MRPWPSPHSVFPGPPVGVPRTLTALMTNDNLRPLNLSRYYCCSSPGREAHTGESQPPGREEAPRTPLCLYSLSPPSSPSSRSSPLSQDIHIMCSCNVSGLLLAHA
ncbi:hypothetical protein NQZ68_012055 [Dissostichus eleginoides]|nr:hypothetical protein NQZ68_012055 [Dissostichus eleginoides]